MPAPNMAPNVVAIHMTKVRPTLQCTYLTGGATHDLCDGGDIRIREDVNAKHFELPRDALAISHP